MKTCSSYGIRDLSIIIHILWRCKRCGMDTTISLSTKKEFHSPCSRDINDLFIIMCYPEKGKTYISITPINKSHLTQVTDFQIHNSTIFNNQKMKICNCRWEMHLQFNSRHKFHFLHFYARVSHDQAKFLFIIQKEE